MVSCTKEPKHRQVVTNNTKNVSVPDKSGAENSNEVLTKQDSLEKALTQYVSSVYLKDQDLQLLEKNDKRFSYERIDLNQDGKDEIFINFSSPYFCGSGGCTVLLLSHDLKLVTRFTVMRPPLYVDSKNHNDWKVLWLQEGDAWKMLKYNNGQYPSNPSILKTSAQIPDSEKTEILNPEKQRFLSF